MASSTTKSGIVLCVAASEVEVKSLVQKLLIGRRDSESSDRTRIHAIPSKSVGLPVYERTSSFGGYYAACLAMDLTNSTDHATQSSLHNLRQHTPPSV